VYTYKIPLFVTQNYAPEEKFEILLEKREKYEFFGYRYVILDVTIAIQVHI